MRSESIGSATGRFRTFRTMGLLVLASGLAACNHCAPKASEAIVPTGSGVIAGTVASVDGEPVADILVDLFDSQSREFLFDSATDAEGQFEFENLVAGCYRLTFVAPEGAEMVDGNGAFKEVGPVCPSETEAVTVDAEVELP